MTELGSIYGTTVNGSNTLVIDFSNVDITGNLNVKSDFAYYNNHQIILHHEQWRQLHLNTIVNTMITDISTSTHVITNHPYYGTYNYTRFTFKTEGYYKIEFDGEFTTTWFRQIYIYLNNTTIIDNARDTVAVNSINDYTRFNTYFIRYFNENDYIDYRVYVANNAAYNKYLNNIKILFTKF